MPTKSKSSIIIKRPANGWNIKRKPTSPGELLVEEFLKPMGITQKVLAFHIGCDIKVINRICNDRSAVTPEIALKLAFALGTSPEFWLNAQIAIDIWKAKQTLEDIPRLKKPA